MGNEFGIQGQPVFQANKARIKVVQDCKSKFTTEQIAICYNYAEKAREEAQWNIDKRCGDGRSSAQNGRWVTNADHHFAFCTAGFHKDADGKEIKVSMKSEEDARAGRNQACLPNLVKQQPNAALERKAKKPSQKAQARPAQAAVPRQNATTVKPADRRLPSAMDRLSGSGSDAPGSGGSSRSRSAVPLRSPGGVAAGARPDANPWAGNALRTQMPSSGIARDAAFRGAVR